MDLEIVQRFLGQGSVVPKGDGKLLIGWGKREWAAAPHNDSRPNFYFPDFFLKVGMPWFSHAEWMEISIEVFLSALEKIEIDPIDEKVEWELTGLSFFETAFKSLKEQIQKKELAKAVPYLFEKTKTAMCKNRLLRSLKSAISYSKMYPGFIYGLWDYREGFLGVTPELLFEFNDKRFKTAACAGTLSAEEEIGEKLFLEHDLVVRGILASLKPFGELEMKPIKRVSFATLTHLITPIEATLKNAPDFKALTSALHPTPALGAFPKEEGMSFLEQFQMRLPRDRFGAPAGFLYKSQAFSVVAIRNVQWGSFGMKIGAGCGIVEGSELVEELNEIKLKLFAIKELLKL